MMAMKLQAFIMLFTIFDSKPAQFARAARVVRVSQRTSDRAITQVVKLLQDMMQKSKTEGERERVLYAKFKCYCEDNGAAKKQELSTVSAQKGLLESRIEEVKSDSEVLSSQVRELSAAMDTNQDARSEAQSVRDKEHASFLALKADLNDAIKRMNDAIQALAEVGSDQTLEAPAADTAQFLAGHKPAAAGTSAGLLGLKTTVRQALLAAQSIAAPAQSATLQAFLQLQDPFTGTYTAQSGQVVGILKDMRDTFVSNLATAQAAEDKAAAAHGKFLKTMKEAHKDLQQSYESKQGSLSTSDSTLGTKKTQLTDASDQRQETKAFIEQLRAMCTQKATEFEERKMLRANEQAAIAQAVSILNSDAAFETFGTVSATSSGPTSSFLQRSSLQRHQQGRRVDAETKLQAQAVLRSAASRKQSVMLLKVAALLKANTPLARVLTEIQNMKNLLAEEEEADDQQLTWCQTERNTNDDNLKEKKTQVNTLESQIASLTSTVDEPRTGLKAMIQGDEEALRTNYENQKTETSDRTEHNLAYQKDIQNLVEAEALLSKAISVLQVYYKQILVASEGGAAFIAISQQARKAKQAPAAPSTWEGSYQGQSSKGNDAIAMLQFILNSTKSEEEAAHDAEKTSQHSYEDSMQKLKDEEQQLQTSIADLRQSLAQKLEELLGKQKDLKATIAEKTSVEAYLSEIKPGCDFISGNIQARKASRATEKAALENACELLRASPAFQTEAAGEAAAPEGSNATM